MNALTPAFGDGRRRSPFSDVTAIILADVVARLFGGRSTGRRSHGKRWQWSLVVLRPRWRSATRRGGHVSPWTSSEAAHCRPRLNRVLRQILWGACGFAHLRHAGPGRVLESARLSQMLNLSRQSSSSLTEEPLGSAMGRWRRFCRAHRLGPHQRSIAPARGGKHSAEPGERTCRAG